MSPSVPQLCKGCSPPPSLFGHLLWREFFFTAATNNPNFDRMEGNPICVQVGVDTSPPLPGHLSSSGLWGDSAGLRTRDPFISICMCVWVFGDGSSWLLLKMMLFLFCHVFGVRNCPPLTIKTLTFDLGQGSPQHVYLEHSHFEDIVVIEMRQ